MQEVYKTITGYTGQFEVSNMGNIIRKEHVRFVPHLNEEVTFKLKIISQSQGRGGYKRVGLPLGNGKYKNLAVHRLVMDTFNPTSDKNLEINHIDCNKKNNCIDNLEWVTHRQNMEHAVKSGRMNHNEKNPKAVLNKAMVKKIWELRKQGKCVSEITDYINPIKRAVVYKVIKGVAWKNLNPNNQ